MFSKRPCYAPVFLSSFLLLASCGITDLQSRRTPVMVEYNFDSGCYVPERVFPWIHQPVIFRVNNINRLAYDVVISSRDSILVENEAAAAPAEPPPPAPDKSAALEAAIELISSVAQSTPASAGKATDASAKANREIDTVLQAASLQNSILATNEKVAIKNIALDTLKRAREHESALVTADTLGAVKSAREAKIAAQDQRIQDAEAAIKQLKQRLREDSARLAKLDSTMDAAHKQYMEVRGRLQALYRKATMQYADIWRSYRLYNDMQLLAADPKTSLEAVKGCKAITRGLAWRDFEAQRQTAAEFFETVAEYRLEYEVFANKDLNVYAAEGLLNRLNAPVFAEKLRMEKMMEDIRAHKPFELIMRAEDLYRRMTDPATYYVISAPIQPSADLVVFDVSIKNKHTADFHDSRKFPYRDFVRGGLRYDFSTGVVFNLGGARDEGFWLRPMDTAGSVRIDRSGNGSEFVPQLAGMFHASIRSRNIVNVGFTLGASINTETFDIGSIFPGLSLMVGRRNKAVFTAGPALKKVHRLKANLEEGVTYLGGQLQADDLTSEVFRVGSFIGISYNLTSRQKSKFKL